MTPRLINVSAQQLHLLRRARVFSRRARRFINYALNRIKRITPRIQIIVRSLALLLARSLAHTFYYPRGYAFIIPITVHSGRNPLRAVRL